MTALVRESASLNDAADKLRSVLDNIHVESGFVKARAAVAEPPEPSDDTIPDIWHREEDDEQEMRERRQHVIRCRDERIARRREALTRAVAAWETAVKKREKVLRADLCEAREIQEYANEVMELVDVVLSEATRQHRDADLLVKLRVTTAVEEEMLRRGMNPTLTNRRLVERSPTVVRAVQELDTCLPVKDIQKLTVLAKSVQSKLFADVASCREWWTQLEALARTTRTVLMRSKQQRNAEHDKANAQYCHIRDATATTGLQRLTM